MWLQRKNKSMNFFPSLHLPHKGEAVKFVLIIQIWIQFSARDDWFDRGDECKEIKSPFSPFWIIIQSELGWAGLGSVLARLVLLPDLAIIASLTPAWSEVEAWVVTKTDKICFFFHQRIASSQLIPASLFSVMIMWFQSSHTWVWVGPSALLLPDLIGFGDIYNFPAELELGCLFACLFHFIGFSVDNQREDNYMSKDLSKCNCL